MNIYVTYKSNIFITEGDFHLRDEKIVGLLKGTHVAPVIMPHPETGQPIHGLVSRAEVYWEHKRTPSPHLEDPDDLFWLNTDSDDESEESESENEENTDDDGEVEESSY